MAPPVAPRVARSGPTSQPTRTPTRAPTRAPTNVENPCSHSFKDSPRKLPRNVPQRCSQIPPRKCPLKWLVFTSPVFAFSIPQPILLVVLLRPGHFDDLAVRCCRVLVQFVRSCNYAVHVHLLQILQAQRKGSIAGEQTCKGSREPEPLNMAPKRISRF